MADDTFGEHKVTGEQIERLIILIEKLIKQLEDG